MSSIKQKGGFMDNKNSKEKVINISIDAFLCFIIIFCSISCIRSLYFTGDKLTDIAHHNCVNARKKIEDNRKLNLILKNGGTVKIDDFTFNISRLEQKKER